MKRLIVLWVALLALSVTAYAADQQKKLTLTVDPPDAAITVLSGSDLKELSYRSPAKISARLPHDQDLARKAVIMISRERYKTVTIPLRNVRDGDVLKIRLEKEVRTALQFRMLAPAQSDDIRIKDGRVNLALIIDEKQLQMTMTNTSPQPIHILWERASYTDVNRTSHRVMHPGIRYEDRNRSLPLQRIMPFMTVTQAVIPVDLVQANSQKKTAETAPLFPLQTLDRIKGKDFELFIPVLIGTEIVPYRFRIKVLGLVQE